MAIAGTSLAGSSSVALAATKPAFTSLVVPASVNQGDKPIVTGTFTDPDAEDQHTVQIFWGDGSADFYTLSVGDRSFSLQKSTGYPGVGSDLSMQVTLSDPLFSVTRFPVITVNNVAPSITSFSLSSAEVDAGSAITATGGFDDPGTADTHTVTIDWGDGGSSTLSLARRVWTFTTAAHTFTAGGTFTVTATVADNNGGSAVATSSVTVHGANQAPNVTSFVVTAGAEGSSSSLALSFTDADAADTHTVTVAWGDGSTSAPVVLSSDVATFDASHTYADNGNYSVELTLGDSAGHTVTATASVSPTNVAPVVGSLSLSPSSVVDHQTLTVSGTFTDPGTADTFTVTIEWGDTTSWSDTLAAGVRSFSATHAYNAAGPVTIKATVTDKDNGRSSSSVDLVVGSSNHAPANLTLDVSGTGANAVVNASFTDADALDPHTVLITWGDGASERPVIGAGATSFTASHVYAASGTYTVGATVTDAAGASTSATTQVVVTVSSGSAADVLDEMSDLVRTFDLDRNTERWLLKKIDDLKSSLAYGNGQVCAVSGLLSHILAFADRTSQDEHLAALRVLTTKLQVAAGCSSNGALSPKALKASTVTPKTTVTPVVTKTETPAPAPKKDTAAKSAKADLKATEGRKAH